MAAVPSGCQGSRLPRPRDLVETDQDWSDKELASGNVEKYRKYPARFAEAHRAGVEIGTPVTAKSGLPDLVVVPAGAK